MEQHFAAQFWAGDLYPHWLLDMNGGLGSPVFFYYPPVAYYLTSLLKPLFSSEVYGWQQLGWSATLALCASGLCGYAWLKRATNREAAFITALLYIAMPYHLAINLYERAALAEFWAFVWMPLILFFVHDMSRRRLISFTGVALSYALLVGTHPPTTLMFSLIPLGYAYTIAEKRQRIFALALTAGAMAFGLCLSAVYVLPVLFMQRFVAINDMLVDYRDNFLFSHLAPWDLEIEIHWAVWTTIALAAYTYKVVARFGAEKVKRASAFWACVAAISFLMMLPLSNFVWWLLKPLQRIQFPWRFNSILCIAATGLVALALSSLKRPLAVSTKLTLGFACLLALSWLPLTGWVVRQSYPVFNPNEGMIAFSRQKLRERRDQPEYRPVWTRGFNERAFEPLLQRIGKTGDSTVRVRVVEGAGEAIIERWQPRDIHLRVESAEGVVLHVGQFYYAGWAGHLDTTEGRLVVRPSPHDGVLRVEVPRGRHGVLLRLERRWPEIAGLLISLLSATVGLIALAFITHNMRKR